MELIPFFIMFAAGVLFGLPLGYNYPSKNFRIKLTGKGYLVQVRVGLVLLKWVVQMTHITFHPMKVHWII